MITADTNVFVYLYDEASPPKRETARAISAALMDRNAPIALQVVGEFQNVLRRKLEVPPWLAAQEARNLMEAFDTFLPSKLGAERALGLMAAGRYSYWDGLLMASAAEAGMKTVLSEDMQDGAEVLDVRIINPFATDGSLSDRARESLSIPR